MTQKTLEDREVRRKIDDSWKILHGIWNKYFTEHKISNLTLLAKKIKVN